MSSIIYLKLETYELYLEMLGGIIPSDNLPIKYKIEPYCSELEALIDCVVVFGTDKTNMQAIRLFTKRSTPPIISIERVCIKSHMNELTYL